MKRFLSILLVLTLIMGTMLIPETAMAASGKITTKYFSLQTVQTYSDSTSSTSLGVRVYFVNGNKKNITKYKATFYFYDSDDNYVSSKSTSWQKKTIKYKKGAWTPFVTMPSNAAYFSYKLSYKCASTSYSKTDSSHSSLSSTTRTKHIAVNSAMIGGEDDDGTIIKGGVTVGSKVQWKNVYNFSVSTGSMTSHKTYYRTYITNNYSKSVYKYYIKYQCYDSDDNYLKLVSTGTKKLTIKKGKSAWSAWITVPNDTYYVVLYSGKVYFK